MYAQFYLFVYLVCFIYFIYIVTLKFLYFLDVKTIAKDLCLMYIIIIKIFIKYSLL